MSGNLTPGEAVGALGCLVFVKVVSIGVVVAVIVFALRCVGVDV